MCELRLLKNSQVREGNLGTVPKLYLVINYDGFPNRLMKRECWATSFLTFKDFMAYNSEYQKKPFQKDFVGVKTSKLPRDFHFPQPIFSDNQCVISSPS